MKVRQVERTFGVDRARFVVTSASDEVERLLDTRVHGGAISVRVALSTREAVVEEVLSDGLGSSVAVARSPRGLFIHMGDSPFDALQRLATMMVRLA